MGIKISKDHLHPSVIESITSLIGDLNQLETTAKGNAVEAINELLANGGNKEELEALIAEIAEGKELIANAVGEPLTAEESFDEMSNDINGLLATFKTNMMNNGVTVENGDKFKQLIDKIATMVEEGSGKGIQYASGDAIVNVSEGGIAVKNEADNMSDSMYLAKITDLGFKPHICVCVCDLDGNGRYIITSVYTEDSGMFFTNQTGSVQYGVYKPTESLYVSNDEITMPFKSDFFGSDKYTKYYAIGVGEEDTTLRDSLADILENKGVDVTEEDDMASLITKVDGISGGLDITSATELPATGRENQICVVTDNPVDSFVVTSEEDFTSVDKIVVFTTSNSPNYEVNNNNLLCRYCIDSVFLNDMLLDSYYYKNSTWNRLTFSNLCLLYQGRYMMESIHGGLYSGSYIKYTPDTGIVIKPSSSTGANIISAFSFKNKIDLTNYSTIEITLKGSNTISGCGCYILASTSAPFNYVGSFTNQTVLKEQSLSLGTDYRTYTFDITSAKGEYYIGFGGYMMNYTITISDFKIC